MVEWTDQENVIYISTYIYIYIDMYMSHYIPHIYSISYVYIYTHSVLLAQSCPTLCEPTDCSPPCLLSPWSSPGKNTGVGYHLLLQGIYPTQGLNPALLHCRHIYTHIYIIVKYFICICIMEYYSAFKKKKRKPSHLQQDGWAWRALC